MTFYEHQAVLSVRDTILSLRLDYSFSQRGLILRLMPAEIKFVCLFLKSKEGKGEESVVSFLEFVTHYVQDCTIKEGDLYFSSQFLLSALVLFLNSGNVFSPCSIR